MMRFEAVEMPEEALARVLQAAARCEIVRAFRTCL